MSGIKVKTNGNFAVPSAIRVKTNGAWKVPNAIYVKTNGSWVKVWPTATLNVDIVGGPMFVGTGTVTGYVYASATGVGPFSYSWSIGGDPSVYISGSSSASSVNVVTDGLYSGYREAMLTLTVNDAGSGLSKTLTYYIQFSSSF